MTLEAYYKMIFYNRIENTPTIAFIFFIKKLQQYRYSDWLRPTENYNELGGNFVVLFREMQPRFGEGL